MMTFQKNMSVRLICIVPIFLLCLALSSCSAEEDATGTPANIPVENPPAEQATPPTTEADQSPDETPPANTEQPQSQTPVEESPASQPEETQEPEELVEELTEELTEEPSADDLIDEDELSDDFDTNDIDSLLDDVGAEPQEPELMDEDGLDVDELGHRLRLNRGFLYQHGEGWRPSRQWLLSPQVLHWLPEDSPACRLGWYLPTAFEQGFDIQLLDGAWRLR